MFHEWISIFLICKKLSLLSTEISNSKCKKLMLKYQLIVKINIEKIKKQERVYYVSFNLILARIALFGEWGIAKVVSPVLLIG